MDPPKREGIFTYLTDFFNILVPNDSKPKKRQPTAASTSTLVSSPKWHRSLRPTTSAAAYLPQYDNSCAMSRKPPLNFCNFCTESHSKASSMDSLSSSASTLIEVTPKNSEIEMDSELLSHSTRRELRRTTRHSPNYRDDHSKKDNRQRSSRSRTRALSRLPIHSSSSREFEDSPSGLQHTEPAIGSRGDHCYHSPERLLKKTHHCPAEYGETREVVHKKKSNSPRKTSIPRPIAHDTNTIDNPIPSTSSGKTEVLYLRRRPRATVNASISFPSHRSEDQSTRHNCTSKDTEASKVVVEEKQNTTSKIQCNRPTFPRLAEERMRRAMACDGPWRRPRVWEELRPKFQQGLARHPTFGEEDDKQPIVHLEGDEILVLPVDFDKPCPPRRAARTEEPANPLLTLARRREEILKVPLDFDKPCTPRRQQPSNPPSREASDLKKKHSSTVSTQTPTPERTSSTSNQEAPQEQVEKKSSIIKVYTRRDRVLRFHSNFTAVDTYPQQPSNPPSREASDLNKKHSSTVSTQTPTPERTLSTSSQESPQEQVEKKSSIIKVYTSDDQVLRFHSNFTAVDTYPVIKACPFRVLRTSYSIGLDSDSENEPTPPGTSRVSIYSSPSAKEVAKLRRAIKKKPKPTQKPEHHPQSRTLRPESEPQVYPSTLRAGMPLVYPSISRGALELLSTSRSSLHSVIQSSSKASGLSLVPKNSETGPSTSREQYTRPSTSSMGLCTPSTPSTSRASTPRTRPNTPKACSISELPTRATCIEIPTYSDTTKSEMLSVSRRNSKTSFASSVDWSVYTNLTTIDEESTSTYSTKSNSMSSEAQADELESAATIAKATRKWQLMNNQFPFDDVELQLLEACAAVKSAGIGNLRAVDAPNWKNNNFYDGPSVDLLSHIPLAALNPYLLDGDTETTTDDSQKENEDNKGN